MLVRHSDTRCPTSTRENAMTRASALGVAALTLLAGAASAQAIYPSTYRYGLPGGGYTAKAPLYDYAPQADVAAATALGRATPHGYGPLIYTPQLYRPTPAFPAPPSKPGYYTARSVVVSRPLYDYAPGYWGR
jgi:hypothetical protein